MNCLFSTDTFVRVATLLRASSSHEALDPILPRSTLWPLLACAVKTKPLNEDATKYTHGQTKQVHLDSLRSLAFGVCRTWFRDRREKEVAKLEIVINETLEAAYRTNKSVHYYQGLNSIASTLLLVLNDEALATQVLARIVR